jgi:ribosomal protein S18 acetylase RimI-like enzyme
MFNIEPIQLNHCEILLEIFNQEKKRNEFLYEALTLEQFKEKFYLSTTTYKIISYVALLDQKLIGFSSGVYDLSTNRAYITMILLDESFRRLGYSKQLLKQLENKLLEQPLQQKKIEIVFFNPVNLSWQIPNTYALHPNAPGIDKEGIGYLFFKSQGYIDFAVQNAYYKDIRNYEYSASIIELNDDLKQKGFIFDYYKIYKDQGLIEMLNNLGSPVWLDTILKHVESKGIDNTLLVPTLNSLVVGFTGPLSVEKSMRGYFAGIGVHSEYRGHGLAKVLFAKLIMGLKEMGAHYMTLFTGENNPARRMYEKEGFEIKRTFIDLRKVNF